jgi:undecaprenyl-diphosphatase
LPDASFPSDHATVSFAFFTGLFLANYKKLWFIFFPFIILMNLSRIIAWVHWPFDIIVWIMVWIIWAIISFKILKKIDTINNFNNFIIKIMKYIKL